MPYDEPIEPPPSRDPEVLEIPVTPRPESLAVLVRRALAAMAFATLLCAGMFEPAGEGWDLGFSALFGIFFAIVVVAATLQLPNPSVLQIGPDYVVTRDLVRGSAFALYYQELWICQKQGRGSREKLVFKNPDVKQISVRTAYLPDSGAADAVLAAVRERIGALPDGKQRLEGIAVRQAVAERLRSARKVVAPMVSIFLGLVFLGEIATGALTNPIRLWAFGATSSFLARPGELFRLATANLLQTSLIHLLFNVTALIALGMFLEPLLGRARFLTVFLVSCLAGAAGASLLGQEALALGVSAGIAGLVGACAAVLLRWPDRLTARFTKKQIWLRVVVVLGLSHHLLQNGNLLAGFFAGLALMYLEPRDEDLLALASRRRGWYRTLAVVLVALFGVACWAAVRHARDHDHVMTDAALAIRDLSLSPQRRNELAWNLVTSPEVSRANLLLTLRGIESDPAQAPYLHTEATAHYRLGHWKEAAEVERELFEADRKSSNAAELARFEWLVRRKSGPLLLGNPPRVLPRAALAPGAIFLDASDSQLPAGSLIHLVLARQGKPFALVEVLTEGRETWPLHYPIPGTLVPTPDQVALTLVDTRKVFGLGMTSWEILPMTPEAARLP